MGMVLSGFKISKTGLAVFIVDNSTISGQKLDKQYGIQHQAPIPFR